MHPTTATQNKISRALRKVKPKLSEPEYKILYPTGSTPTRFFVAAKMYMLKAMEQLINY